MVVVVVRILEWNGGDIQSELGINMTIYGVSSIESYHHPFHRRLLLIAGKLPCDLRTVYVLRER